MKLINNIENLNKFINQLTDGWFYIFIVARKKWYSDLSKGEIPIHRIFVHKNQIISKLQSLELLEYKNFDGSDIPEDSIGVYINPNIRSFTKGLTPLAHSYFQNLSKFDCVEDKEFLKLFCSSTIDKNKNLTENPFEFLLNFTENKNINKFFKSEMKTIMSTSRGEKRFIDIDIDCLVKGQVDRKLLNPIFNFIFEQTGANLHIIQTKSGAHVLIESSTIKKEFEKTFHQALNKAKSQFQGFEIDFQGGSDKLTPCPGTKQSVFVPEYYKY